MGPFDQHRLVECKTIDGTSISGLFYPVEGPPAPAIVMSHGFNCVKEMTLPDIARSFHTQGFNVLLYDARSVGASGGRPRNLLDPLQMAEDLSDIYTYVSRLPTVDATKIALWGISFGAVVSATAAAIDRRPKAVVMVCPLFRYIESERADRVYTQLIKDRVSQLRGNDPYSLPLYTPKGDNLAGFGGSGGPGGLQVYNLMKAASQRGTPNFSDRISLQTYHKLAMFRPLEYLDMLRAPVMMIIPEFDDISSPTEQREALGRITAAKREYLAHGKDHINVTSGDGADDMVAATVQFIRDVLEGDILK
ncbi:DltD domain-containing protein [Xylariaceae sp. FL0255]|nr:DltD domain-containing protein [Xylariaceae sp. FL0255]